MKRITLAAIVLFLSFIVMTPNGVDAAKVDVKPLVEKIRAVGPKGEGHRDAVPAIRALSGADVSQVPEILAGMDGANPLAENWIRAAVETIADRQLRTGGALPVGPLERFLADASHAPRARRLAYELIARVDGSAEQRLIPGLLNDPSLELRRDAVALVLKEGTALEKTGDKEKAIAVYRKALAAARDLDQIKLAATKLREFGEKVDLPAHFGFLMRWKLIAPFDNTNKGGFDVDYPPEREIDLAATYQGKVGKVQWIHHVTRDDYGLVDLNDVYGRPKSADGQSYVDTPETLRKHKGAIGYAYAAFFSEEERDVELRLGCINANKIWLNGQLLTANHVFHTNMEVDQYVGRGRLQKGRNTILLKIAQNEQSESWAQGWRFQLRVCDQIGTAILSQDRPFEQHEAAARGGR